MINTFSENLYFNVLTVNVTSVMLELLLVLLWSLVILLPLAGHDEAFGMPLLSHSASFSSSIAVVLIGDHIGLEKPARFSDSQGALCAEVTALTCLSMILDTETTCSGQAFILNTLELV